VKSMQKKLQRGKPQFLGVGSISVGGDTRSAEVDGGEKGEDNSGSQADLCRGEIGCPGQHETREKTYRM